MIKKRKLAMIRQNDADPCPFGLPVPFACKNAGLYMDKLAPLDVMGKDSSDEEKQQIADANVRMLAWLLMHGTQELKNCPYANKIFKEQEAVECNYGDSAPGVKSTPLLGSPFYSQIFSGVGLNGLYAYPIGYYGDYNTSRNSFYGIYSLQGSSIDLKSFRKLAEKVAKKAFEKSSGNKNE